MFPRQEEELHLLKQQLEQKEVGFMRSIESLQRCLVDTEKRATMATHAMLREHTKVIEAAEDLRTDLRNQKFTNKEDNTSKDKRDREPLELELWRDLQQRNENNNSPQQEFLKNNEYTDYQRDIIENDQGHQDVMGSKSECEDLRKDLLLTQHHLHLIHEQQHLHNNQKMSKSNLQLSQSLNESLLGVNSFVTSQETPELELEQRHSSIELSFESEKKTMQEKLEDEISLLKEKLSIVEEKCTFLQQQNGLLEVQAVHNEFELHTNLGSAQLEAYEGLAQFSQLKKEMEINAEKENRKLIDLERELFGSKEAISKLERRSTIELQEVKAQLQISQEESKELLNSQRKYLQELNEQQVHKIQEKGRDISKVEQELSKNDHEQRIRLIENEQIEVELKEKLQKSEATLKEVQEMLSKSMEECKLLKGDFDALKLEAVHSEFEVHMDLGMTQVQLGEFQKQYEGLKEEIKLNALKEKKYLQNLESELVRVACQKDKEYSRLDQHHKKSLIHKEHTEAELRDELLESRNQLIKTKEILQDTQEKLTNLQDAIPKEIEKQTFEMAKLLQMTQLELSEAKKKYVLFKKEMEETFKTERKYVESLQKKLLDSQKQDRELSRFKRVSLQNLKDEEDALPIMQDNKIVHQVVHQTIKREIGLNEKDDKQYLLDLKQDLFESKQELLTFKRKMVQDLEYTKEELSIAQLEAQDLLQENRSLLQELKNVKNQLEDTQEEHLQKLNFSSQQLVDIQNERDGFSTEEQMLSVKLENLYLQAQMKQVLQEMNSLKEASANLLNISIAKNAQESPNVDGEKDIALSMLAFVEDVANLLKDMHNIFANHRKQQQRMRQDIINQIEGSPLVLENSKENPSHTMDEEFEYFLDDKTCKNSFKACHPYVYGKCSKEDVEDKLKETLKTYGIGPNMIGIPDDICARLHSERSQRYEGTHYSTKDKHASMFGDVNGNLLPKVVFETTTKLDWNSDGRISDIESDLKD